MDDAPISTGILVAKKGHKSGLRSAVRKLQWIVLTAAMVYAVAEAALTGYETIFGDALFYFLIERTQTEPIRFDPASGYRFASTPHRVSGVWFGETEFNHVLQANRQGFPDTQDFHPQRERANVKRIAVFGDSFSSAMHLETNWPNRADELCQTRGLPVEFLNFSLDGVGLANWWSIVHNLLDPENYELDAIVFACFTDNLDRRFLFWDSRNTRRVACGRSVSWDPATYPKTYEQASQRFRYPALWVVDSQEYDNLTLRQRAPYHLSLLGHVRTVFWMFTTLALKGDDLEDPHRLSLLQDMGGYVNRRQLPVYLLTIPSRPQDFDVADVEKLIGWKNYMSAETVEDHERFCDITGARVWDFTETYQGLTLAEVHDLWNVNDPHTNQKGSDRMAEFVVERVTAGFLGKAPLNADGLHE